MQPMTTSVALHPGGSNAIAADLEPLCADCLAHEGLCRIHARDVLPAPLRTNFPAWLIGQSHYDERKEESPEARVIRERKARKRSRATSRLVRAVAGGFTRTRNAA
jgi:hypothetical protein